MTHLLKDLSNINSYLLSCLTHRVFCTLFSLAQKWGV